jgi:hypothetical protein
VIARVKMANPPPELDLGAILVTHDV